MSVIRRPLAAIARLRPGAKEALRGIAGRPRLLPITALLLRARTVRPATVFLMRASLGRKETSVYRLRESGLRVAIRHGTGDVVTLGEVFHQHDYEPAGEVASHLGQVARIVDLGANIGLFGAFAAARWPLAEIVGFEPDPGSAAVHERTIALNGLQARWRLVRAAAGPTGGRASFIAGDIALSRLADEQEASRSAGEDEDRSSPALAGAGFASGSIEVAIEDVLPQIAEADLVKMDIEGGEWAILRDSRFRAAPPRVIVLEYHPRFAPSGNPRRAVESALELAGLHVQSIWHRADGHGMLWAWRR